VSGDDDENEYPDRRKCPYAGDRYCRLRGDYLTGLLTILFTGGRNRCSRYISIMRISADI